MWFPTCCGAVTLLIFFLSRQAPDNVSPSILQGPKWACLTYCTHVESSYLTIKPASSDLPFAERSVWFVKWILVKFRNAWFSRCVNFRIYHSPTKFRHANYFGNRKVVFKHENFAPWIIQEVRYHEKGLENFTQINPSTCVHVCVIPWPTLTSTWPL